MSKIAAPKFFTLLELLIVVAIMAILMAMLLPALKKAKDSVARVSCVNKLKQIGTGIFMYSGDYNGYLPITWDAGGGSGAMWHSDAIAPYLAIKSKYPAIYECPSDKYVWRHPTTGGLAYDDPSYGLSVMCGAGTAAAPYKKLAQFRNPSRKIMLGEKIRTWEGGASTSHTFEITRPNLSNYRHRSGSNVAWFDGHVIGEVSNRISDINNDVKYWGLEY